MITPLKYENEHSDFISIFCEKQCWPKRITTCKVQRQFLKIGRSLLYTDCIINFYVEKMKIMLLNEHVTKYPFHFFLSFAFNELIVEKIDVSDQGYAE